MNIKELLIEGSEKLKNENIDESILKAKLILCYILKVNKEYLIIHSNDEMNEKIKKKYNNYINELISGKPLQYITNKQEFMGMDFYVDENVLIPRPDTEILVEEAIKISNKNKLKKILDLCTGSGAIGISCSKYLNNVEVTASDISEKALRIAKINAEKNNIEIAFIKSDLFDDINNKFDIIVSNPPYIKTNVIKKLEPCVQREPLIALDGGESGLDFYKRIIENAPNYLNENGYLCLEIGYDQKNEVEELIKNTNKYYDIYCKKDLGGNNRIIIARLMPAVRKE